ncbi:MAG: HAD-IA family hydrolase [Acidobacteriota bacterium]|nr:MAG: HAD-IA family hydrolase [Acidobacteriota bacterium]
MEISAKEILAIGIDLMDTLIYDPFREAVTDATGLSLADLAPLRNRDAWHAFELDQIDEQGYAAEFFKPEVGRRLDVARLKARLREGYHFLDGMESLLAELSERRAVHILSNYSRWYEHLRERFALDRFVTAHHPSWQLGVRKPAREYFERVLERIEVRPSALLFIDDRQQNVDGARKVGIPALLFRGGAVLRRELAPLLN